MNQQAQIWSFILLTALPRIPFTKIQTPWHCTHRPPGPGSVSSQATVPFLYSRLSDLRFRNTGAFFIQSSHVLFSLTRSLCLQYPAAPPLNSSLTFNVTSSGKTVLPNQQSQVFFVVSQLLACLGTTVVWLNNSLVILSSVGNDCYLFLNCIHVKFGKWSLSSVRSETVLSLGPLWYCPYREYPMNSFSK